MSLRFWHLGLVILSGMCGSAQTDSVRVHGDREDCIYLAYSDFRRNIFISKNQLISDFDKDQLDFIARTMSQEKFSYTTSNGKDTRSSNAIWGFYQNNVLFINYRGIFIRVTVFGSICYFTVGNAEFIKIYGTYVKTKMPKELIANFYDGRVTEFTTERAEELLSRDPDLFAEYKELGGAAWNGQLKRYIRRFNETHPVYFIK